MQNRMEINGHYLLEVKFNGVEQKQKRNKLERVYEKVITFGFGK